jgi:hypothetical protein
MKCDRFFHILHFLHLTDSNKQPDGSDKVMTWKLRTSFDTLTDSYAGFYSPSERLAVDEVIVLFKERVVSRHYIPKKHKHFGIEIYKLGDSAGYAYDKKAYLGRERKCNTRNNSYTCNCK